MVMMPEPINLYLCTYKSSSLHHILYLYFLNLPINVTGEELLHFVSNIPIDCLMFVFCVYYRYFEALVNNMSFVKYKEVYAAAAEVLGLILQHVTEKNPVSATQCACGSHYSNFCLITYFVLHYFSIDLV